MDDHTSATHAKLLSLLVLSRAAASACLQGGAVCSLFLPCTAQQRLVRLSHVTAALKAAALNAELEAGRRTPDGVKGCLWPVSLDTSRGLASSKSNREYLWR